MSARSVCRSHLDRHIPRQSVAPVVRFDGLCTHRKPAPGRPGGSDLAQATCGTIRRKLFKIGALVTISVRRIKLAMASGCPYKSVFAQAHRALVVDSS